MTLVRTKLKSNRLHSCLKFLRLRRHENCLYFARARSRTLKTHTRICSSKIVLARASCCHCSFETFCMSNVARASFACTSNILHVQVVCTSKTFLNEQKMEGKTSIVTTTQRRIKHPCHSNILPSCSFEVFSTSFYCNCSV